MTPEPELAPDPPPEVDAPAGGAPDAAAIVLAAILSLTFPARERVKLTVYEVTGWTPDQISSSIGANGPHSVWLSSTATAHVDVTVYYDFRYERTGGDCTVVATAAAPVHMVYEVVLPTWTPPANVADDTVAWWTDMITDLAAHEAGHVLIYERHLPALNQTVRDESCATVERELEAQFGELDRAHCEYDLAEYGSKMGLTMESCLAAG